MKDKPSNYLKPHIKLGHYSFDDVFEHFLTSSDCAWMTTLLDELEENVDREDKDYQRGSLELNLSLKRKSGMPFGDHLLIKGLINGHYFAPCVRCLKLTQQQIHGDFKAAYLPKSLENQPEFSELDDIFTENDEYELYFHDKGNIDMAELVHENTFLTINHFPLHNENCLGLCPECGHDRNAGPCPRHEKDH